jgi:Zn-dependent protease
VPIAFLALSFAVFSLGAGPLLVLGAAALGGFGGALSLIVHELGHVRAARRLQSVRPKRISLICLGAATQFEGAYRGGREQVRVALGGPAASFVFALALTLGIALPTPRAFQYGCFGLALLNAAIAVLTLLPVHPLDGHKLVVGLIWCLSGGEAKARKIVRRVGVCCIALDLSAAAYATVQRPMIGVFVVLVGTAAYGQKYLVEHFSAARASRSSQKT